MAKVKKKLTSEQKLTRKAAKAEQQKKFEWVFMSGKRVRVKRQLTIDGMGVDEYIQRNSDPIWLHHNGMHELIEIEEVKPCKEKYDSEFPF